MRTFGANIIASPAQVVDRALFLATAHKDDQVSVAGPDGLTAMVALCRASFDKVECARQATSSMANNGQTMASLNANSVFYNATTAVAMLAGRFGLAALAGRFAAQGRLATTSGTLPSDSLMFGALVFGTVLIVAALNFVPALALGPALEALQG